MWYFERIPESEQGNVLTMYAAGDFDGLNALYEKYDVYPPGFCGVCKKKNIIKEWTLYLIVEYWQQMTPPPADLRQ